MPAATQRLTIFEKLEIVNFAEKTVREFQESMPAKKEPAVRAYVKGLNLQAVCRQKFGAKLGGIKICVLRKQAKEQKWRLLTTQQQKTMYQLKDVLKLSLGVTSSLKGYKAMNAEQLEKPRIQEGDVQMRAFM